MRFTHNSTITVTNVLKLVPQEFNLNEHIFMRLLKKSMFLILIYLSLIL